MPRHIDADKFAERIKVSPAFPNMGFEGHFLRNVVLDLLDNAPTADVLKVVRCKDCKYWGGATFGYICRAWSGMTFRNYTKPDNYCCLGERKERK